MDTLILEICKSSIFRDNLNLKAFNLQDNKLRKITITLIKLELSSTQREIVRTEHDFQILNLYYLYLLGFS